MSGNGVDLPLRRRGLECSESAHFARRGSPRRRSPDRTDSRRSEMLPGTGQNAPQLPFAIPAGDRLNWGGFETFALSGGQPPGPLATTVKLGRASAALVLCTTLNAATGLLRPFSSR